MSSVYSIEQVRDIVENEGLGYAVQCYCGADKMPTQELVEHWQKAAEHLDAIDKILKEAE